MFRPGAGVDLIRSLSPRLPAVGWQRNVYALTAASFLLSMGFVFVMPLVPLLMAQLVGDDGAKASAWSGLAFAMSPIMGSLTAPLWGWFSDRRGQRLVMLQALASLGVLMSLMSLSSNAMHLVLLRGGVGALGAFSPAAMAAIAAYAPREQTGRAVGTIQAAQVAGSVIGPLLGGIIADHFGLRVPFVMVIAIFGLAFVIVLRLYHDAPDGQREAGPAKEKGGSGFSAFWFLWMAVFTVQFADATFSPMLPLYLRSLSVPIAAVASISGLTISLGSLGWAISSYLAPRLGERKKAGIIQTGLLIGMLLNLPVALATEWWQLPPLRASLGLLNGAIMTLAYTVVAERAGRGREGAAMAALASAGMIGWACGALITGVVATAGPRLVFGMDVLLLASCAAIWWVTQPLGDKKAGSIGGPLASTRSHEARSALLLRRSGQSQR